MPFITQGKTNLTYLLIVVVLAIIVGGGVLSYYYSWIKDLETKLAEIETKLPEKKIVASKEKAIKNLLAGKHSKDVSEITIEINQETENHARGNVLFQPGGPENAGMFLVAKINNKWELVHDGQGAYACSIVEQYNFPEEMIDDCLPDCFSVSDGICPKWCAAGSDYDCCIDKGHEWIAGKGCYPKEETRSLRVVAPNGGETLCLEDDFIIRWESKELETVRVAIRIPGGNISYLGTFPATFNEAQEAGVGTLSWKVGEYLGGTIGESFTYKILIESNDGQINDVSDDLFSIIGCEG